MSRSVMVASRCRDDRGRGVTIGEAMHGRRGLVDRGNGQGRSRPAADAQVREFHALGQVRRSTGRRGAGRACVSRASSARSRPVAFSIPKTARSQILGGIVMGIGMALHEEVITDHRLGRVMNHNLSEYHVPSHTDVPEIEVIFVDEQDDKASPIGVKGLGEIGIVGTAAAVANAIFHATGRRVREFPITIDKILKAEPQV